MARPPTSPLDAFDAFVRTNPPHRTRKACGVCSTPHGPNLIAAIETAYARGYGAYYIMRWLRAEGLADGLTPAKIDYHVRAGHMRIASPRRPSRATPSRRARPAPSAD